MAQRNRISATLSQQQVDNIKQAIETIKANLPQTVQLTPQERKNLPKMGDKTVAFVNKALDYAKVNPNLVPPYLSVEEFEKDMQLVNQLNHILRPLHSLVEQLSDTAMLAGSESYSAASVFYQSVRTASEIEMPGTTNIFQDLQKRYPRKGRPTKEDVNVEGVNPSIIIEDDFSTNN